MDNNQNNEQNEFIMDDKLSLNDVKFLTGRTDLSQVEIVRPKKKVKKRRKDPINNSGQGKVPVVNLVSKKFNWGAYVFTCIWGAFNNVFETFYILLLWPLSYFSKDNLAFSIIVIILSVVAPLWFGIKGNTLAWQNKRYRSIQEFHEIQKKWAIAAAVVICLQLLALVVSALAILNFIQNNPDKILQILSGLNV